MMRYGWLIGLAAVFVVVFLSPLASLHPDGLERVAEDQGFSERAQEPGFRIIPDYAFPGIANPSVSTIFAGVLGALLTFGLVFALAKAITRRRSVV